MSIRVGDTVRFTVNGETVVGTVSERVTDTPSFTVNGETVRIYDSAELPCSVVRDSDGSAWLVPDVWNPIVL